MVKHRMERKEKARGINGMTGDQRQSELNKPIDFSIAALLFCLLFLKQQGGADKVSTHYFLISGI